MVIGILTANFFSGNVVLETEFYLIDWYYDMIDFAVPLDKQFIFSLTNSRCYLFKETTYIE